MIEPTDEIVEALRRKLQPTPFEPTLRPAVAAMLAIVERDYVLMPRGDRPEMPSDRLGPDRPVADEDWARIQSVRATAPYVEGDWTDRFCDGCDRHVAARTKTGRVLCTSCHPGDLPFQPGDVIR